MQPVAARKRWRTEEGESRARSVIERLAAGHDLGGLGLDRTDEGLIDLRGLSLPVARIAERREIAGYYVESRETLRLTEVVLDGIDLSSAVLDHLWLTGAQVSNCRFDGAQWRDGRIWRSAFRTCSFVGAKLRDLGIAPEERGHRSVFDAVDFTRADLRGLACPAAVVRECSFSMAELDKVDFGGTRFSDTVFSGRLNDVVFRDRPWDDDGAEPNQMINVDFGDAELCYVEFRGLAMDRVTWPTSENNQTFAHFPCVVAGVMDALASDRRPAARAVRAGFEVRLRWAHPEQQAGTVHTDELEGLEGEVLPLMRRLEAECARRASGAPLRRSHRFWRRRH